MGNSLSASSTDQAIELINEAQSRCLDGVSAGNNVTIDGVVLKNCNLTVSQTSEFSASCYLESLIQTAATAVNDASSDVQSGLGFSVGLSQAETEEYIRTSIMQTCLTNPDLGNNISITNAEFSDCEVVLTQNASANVTCQINAVENLILDTTTAAAAEAKGSSLSELLFGGGIFTLIAAIIVIIIIIIIIAVVVKIAKKSMVSTTTATTTATTTVPATTTATTVTTTDASTTSPSITTEVLTSPVSKNMVSDTTIAPLTTDSIIKDLKVVQVGGMNSETKTVLKWIGIGIIIGFACIVLYAILSKPSIPRLNGVVFVPYRQRALNNVVGESLYHSKTFNSTKMINQEFLTPYIDVNNVVKGTSNGSTRRIN